MSNAGGDSTPDSREAPNHYGTVFLQYAGKAVPLRFTWETIHQLQQDHGLAGWMDFVALGLDNLDIAAMARMMEIVANVPEDRARALCVPVLPAKNALVHAWSVAMTGGLPVDPEAEKPTPRGILSGMLSKLRFGRGSLGANSGNSPRTQPA